VVRADATERLRIGPIEARIEPEAVRAYARATAVDDTALEEGHVPATFPAVWLWHPAAAQAVAAESERAGRAPVLMAQRFTYHETLRVGATYRFEIERRADLADADLVHLEAVLSQQSGQVAATFAATYRLVALAERELTR
jgi:hypothetical protein